MGSASLGRPIRAGFLGLSIEYPAVTAYTGADRGAINPVFEQLVRNLAPEGSPVIRIGGDSTDVTWWPTPGHTRPRGVTFALTPRWLKVVAALARDLRARLILGVDLEARRPWLAAVEARALLSGIGRARIAALEIGNEPSRYREFAWYRTASGRRVFARARTYTFSDFEREYGSVARLIPRGVALAGPTLAGFGWFNHISEFLDTQPRVRLVTFHRYTLNRCFTPRGSPQYPTVTRLLSPFASRWATGRLRADVALVHMRGRPFRVDETNSVACAGKVGVSNTFASALWAVDAMFALVQAGADGANVHTFPGAAYGLFDFARHGHRWQTTVSPEYYGLLMFARSAPAGSRLLATRVSAVGRPAVRAWATRSVQGTTRVVLINDDRTHAHRVVVQTGRAATRAQLLRLIAPGAAAQSRATLGGRSIGAAGDGSLGKLSAPTVPPVRRGAFAVSLAPASAVLLTMQR